MDITIGIPAYNEEKNIASIIVKLKKIAQKIIVCNDGSTDLTGEIAQKLGAVVINHPKNLGYGSGIRSIFQKAKEIDSDILVTFDADGQHQVEDIKKVIEPILKNEVDVVIGSRYMENKNVSTPEYRKIGIGCKLIDSLKIFSKDKSISLYTQVSNINATKFYKKNKFKIVEEIEDYYSSLDDKKAYFLKYVCK